MSIYNISTEDTPAEAGPTLADLRQAERHAADAVDRLRVQGSPRQEISKAKAAHAIALRGLKTAEEEIKVAELAAKAARRAPKVQRPSSGTQLPVIDVSSEPDGVRAVIEVLESGQIPEVYLYGAKPTQVGRDANGPTLTALDANGLTLVMLEQADVQKIRTTKDGDEIVTSVLLPPRVASVALARTRWNLPVLKGISSTPLLLPDGSFQLKPGFHSTTGYYFEPRHNIDQILSTPTAQQIANARALILEQLLVDFPWKRASDRATFVALMFYPLLRVLVDDPFMLTVLSATNPGSGKSLLTTILSTLYGTGKTTWAHDNTEMGKTITSVLTSDANPIVLFDNLPSGHVIRFPVLSELITSSVWSQRLLGKNDMAKVPNGRAWIANGNNLSTGDDTARRAIWCILDPDVRPDTRDPGAFVLGDLNEWLPLHAGQVLQALLVLLAGWVADGMPRSDHDIASFGAWPRTLGGILAWMGVEGWLEGREEQMQEGDDDAQEWAAFLAAWHQHFGGQEVKSKDVLAAGQTEFTDYGMNEGPLADTFPKQEGGKFLPTVKQLGHWLKARDGRHFGEHRLRRRYDTHSKVTWWHVEYTPATLPQQRPPVGQETLT